MLNNEPFYFGTTERMTSYFGTLFSKITIVTKDESNNTVESLKVPIMYAGKDKLLVRADMDPDGNRPIATKFPFMSYLMTGIEYDESRKTASTLYQARRDPTDVNKFLRQYNPVPYNLSYELYIVSNKVSDVLKISEQIYPEFTPDWTATLQMVPEMEEYRDVPLILNGVQFEDRFDGEYGNDQRRVVMNTLRFTMKTWFYGPVKHKPIIKYSNMDFYMGTSVGNTLSVNASPYVGTVQTVPGLTVGGQPSTDPNNTVSPLIIDVNNDYGFITTANGIVGLEN